MKRFLINTTNICAESFFLCSVSTLTFIFCYKFLLAFNKTDTFNQNVITFKGILNKNMYRST